MYASAIPGSIHASVAAVTPHSTNRSDAHVIAFTSLAIVAGGQ